jgi:hypothetical protein
MLPTLSVHLISKTNPRLLMMIWKWYNNILNWKKRKKKEKEKSFWKM